MKKFRLPSPIPLLVILAVIIIYGIIGCRSRKVSESFQATKTDSSALISKSTYSNKKKDSTALRVQNIKAQFTNKKSSVTAVNIKFRKDSSNASVSAQPAIQIRISDSSITVTGNTKGISSIHAKKVNRTDLLNKQSVSDTTATATSMQDVEKTDTGSQIKKSGDTKLKARATQTRSIPGIYLIIGIAAFVMLLWLFKKADQIGSRK